MMILLLTVLIFLPIITFWLGSRKAPEYKYMFTGIAFGAIVAPLSIGLYAWFHLSIFGIIPGGIGFVLSLIHEPPGYQAAVALGLVQKGEVVSSLSQHISVEALNGVFWSVIYGLLGYLLDQHFNKGDRSI